MASLSLITAPASKPLTTVEAKQHLRVTGADEDALIDALISAATEHSEAILNRALITQTWDFKIDYFAPCIEMPLPPLQSVTSVKYIDTSGVEQIVDGSVYTVDTDSETGRVYLSYNQSWPSTRSIPHAVTIRFIAGYGNAGSDVPDSVKAAIKLMIGNWFENREQSIVGTVASELPMGVKALLSPYAVNKM